MKKRTYGYVLMALWCLLPGCAAEELPAQEDGNADTAVDSEALEAETLLVDANESFDCHLFGTRKDYVFPIGGRTIKRHDFQAKVRGHANAEIVSMDSNEVKVHAWCDMFSGYSFSLKVWVQ